MLILPKTRKKQPALQLIYFISNRTGLSSLGVPGVPGVPWHTQILSGQLTLFQPGWTDYAHLITTGTPRFSDLATALMYALAEYTATYYVYIDKRFRETEGIVALNM